MVILLSYTTQFLQNNDSTYKEVNKRTSAEQNWKFKEIPLAVRY
jgi:hypothetical protein